MRSMPSPAFNLTTSPDDGGGPGSLKTQASEVVKSDEDDGTLLGDFKVNSPVKTKELLEAINSCNSKVELIAVWTNFWARYQGQKMPDSLPESKLPPDYIRKKFGENVIEKLSNSQTHFSITGTMLEKDFQYSKDYHNNLLIWTSDLPIEANLAKVKDLLDDEAWQVIKYFLPEPDWKQPEPFKKDDDYGGTPIPPDPGNKYQYDRRKGTYMAEYLEDEQGIDWRQLELKDGEDRWVSAHPWLIERPNYFVSFSEEQFNYLKGRHLNENFFKSNTIPDNYKDRPDLWEMDHTNK